MDDLFPGLFRRVWSLLSSYGLVALIPLLVVAIWVVFPRGQIRLAAAVVIAIVLILLFFGDHPAISSIVSAMGAAVYQFRSMLR